MKYRTVRVDQSIFGPNIHHRAAIIIKNVAKKYESKAEAQKRITMSWAVRLKRAFSIDIQICKACGGAVKDIACIDDLVVINKILEHIKTRQDSHSYIPSIELHP